jgi:ATP-binding cassette subfamily B protein
LKNNISKYIYLQDQKKLITLILIAIAGSAVLGFLTPIYIADLYESYKADGDTNQAIYSLVGVFIGEYFTSILYQLSINKYIQKLLQKIRSGSYNSWMTSLETGGKGNFGDQKYPMGEVLSRVLTDTEAVIEMVSSGAFKIFIDFAFIISCLISFIKLNTISGVALITAEVVVCILLIIGSKKMGQIYMDVRKSIGVMSRVIANLAGGFRFTFFHPHHRYASKKGYTSFEDFLKKQLVANIWDASYFSIADSIFPILLALLVIIFPYSNIVEMAVIATIVDLIQRSISPIKEVASKISSIQRARTGIIRIEEFNRDLETLPRSFFDGIKERFQLEKLTFKVSHFEYPNSDQKNSFALRDIEFSAGPGELVGIVGQSGCGKSTILKMLATDIISDNSHIYFRANERTLNICEKNIDDLLSYKGQVSIVSQDSHIFSSSLKFNITMSYDDKNDIVEFWNMVQQNIPYIKTWGVSLDEILDPKTLSLGQKQLVCALRSCYLAKPIVLFDEISSGLDSELEEALKKLVLLIQEKSLTFIVAHRIETITNANQIIVMDKGSIVANGTHEDLLSNSAPYQEFISELNKI